MKFTICFLIFKALKKQDAKAIETEELVKNKVVKYESEKKQVSLAFILLWFKLLYNVICCSIFFVLQINQQCKPFFTL